MIRLIATDLDGTLLGPDGRVSQSSAQAVKMARELGVIVCLVSGRIHAQCLPFHTQLGLDTPIIAVNGAWIQHGAGLLERRPLPNDAFEEAFRFMRPGISALAAINDKMVYLTENKGYISGLMGFKENGIHFSETKTYDELLERVRASGCESLGFYSDEPGALTPIRAELAARFPETLDITSSWATNFEVCAGGVNKGYGVERLAQIYGIAPKDVLALGDHDNDVSMFRFAGHSVAMGNASAAARAAAQFVTATNANDGFAEAVERFVLKKGGGAV